MTVAVWDIPDSWVWTTTGEISEVVGGGTPRTEVAEYYGDEVAWITPADLSGYRSKHIERGSRSITHLGLDNSGARLMPPGTVLLSSRAPIGYVAIAKGPVATNQGFKSFVLRDGVVSDYIYHYLKYAKPLLDGLASGTTFPELSGKKAAIIPVPLAPSAEQMRIAAELDRLMTILENGVDEIGRQHAKLAAYRAAVLRAACEGRLISTKTDWKDGSLGDYIDELQNGVYLPQNLYGNGTPIIRIADFHDYRSRASSELRKVTADSMAVEKYALRVDDILINRVNSAPDIGKCLVIKPIHLPAIYESNMMRLRLKAGLLPDFLRIVLMSKPGRAELTKNAKWAVNQVSINQKDVAATHIRVPPLELQREIIAEVERRLSVVEHLGAATDANLARAKRLRQAILKRAFEGRLVPQDPRDEPASEMLARIRKEREGTTNLRMRRRLHVN